MIPESPISEEDYEKQQLAVIDTLLKHQKLFAETAFFLASANAVGYANRVYDRTKNRHQIAAEAVSRIARTFGSTDWHALALIVPSMFMLDVDDAAAKDDESTPPATQEKDA